VLEGVNFTVDEGEFIYIIGKVGSGKSSLLKTFYGDMDIDSADEAMVLGRDMMDVRRKEIQRMRREMGIIFQDFQLLSHFTVYKNLRFVLRATGWKKSEVDNRIEEVLSLVGMKDKMLCLPHELSGGEQQRVAIARALLNSPKMIVADEPTGNLDPETAKSIMEILRQISQKGTAVVMSTHNMPLMNLFPGIVYRCFDGKMEKISSEEEKQEMKESLEEENEYSDPLCLEEE
jgi:cell division transport system ATP-binding protein